MNRRTFIKCLLSTTAVPSALFAMCKDKIQKSEHTFAEILDKEMKGLQQSLRDDMSHEFDV